MRKSVRSPTGGELPKFTASDLHPSLRTKSQTGSDLITPRTGSPAPPLPPSGTSIDIPGIIGHGRKNLCTLSPAQAKKLEEDCKRYGVMTIVRSLSIPWISLSRARKGLTITKAVREKILRRGYAVESLNPVPVLEGPLTEDEAAYRLALQRVQEELFARSRFSCSMAVGRRFRISWIDFCR